MSSIKYKRDIVLMLPFVNSSFSDSEQNNKNSEDESWDKIISDECVLIAQWILFAVIAQPLEISGAVSNVINIICFVKQGLKDPINVSLFGLAISDLGCLVTLIWVSMGLTPEFQNADLPFDNLEVSYLTAGWPHDVFTGVTSWITALITLERCLCIMIPLKVKTMVTPRRVSVIIVSVFAVLICSAAPVYCVNMFAMKYNAKRNKTILGLVYTHDREDVEKVSIAINNAFIPFTAFITVLVCTITLVIQLQQKSKWRRSVSSADASNTISSRDKKVSKMVVMISCLFIASFIPVSVIFIAMMLKTELAVDGKYKDIFMIVCGLGFILESTNSAMNIFIYYRMSSKYRAAFHQLFRRGSYKVQENKNE